MKDLETTATVEVISTRERTNEELSNDRNDNPAKYEILYKGTDRVKFDGEYIESEIKVKSKSHVKLSKGEHRVVISSWKKDQFSKPIYTVLSKVGEVKQQKAS